jgi:hypothetical protein
MGESREIAPLRETSGCGDPESQVIQRCASADFQAAFVRFIIAKFLGQPRRPA